MTIVSDFQTGVSEALKLGQKVRIKYYDVSYGAGSYYDDDVTLSQSGDDLWISGVILPISNTRGSSDAVLLEQGKILMSDTKLYIDGTISTSGTIKVGLGSYSNMSGCEYSLLGEGVTKWKVSDADILKKLYIRYLPNGSLMGE
ncbi:MAG: hypothetical protein ACFFDS_08000 [Candidatus Thorarchaeota archaeon]